MNTGSLDPKDYKFIVQNPIDFNPARNKAIIAETIAKADKFFGNIRTALDGGMLDRLDVMASYGLYRFGRGNKKLREFLGESTYKKLVGEKLLDRISVAKMLDQKNNNKKLKGWIQT